MNPQFDKPINLNLPPPMPEAAPLSASDSGSAPEIARTPIEQAPHPVQQPQATQQVTVTAPLTMAPTLQPMPPGSTAVITTTTPPLADDQDLIEKEWVAKAKEVIERNRENPHRQTKEISVVKADYMKKRYNKDLKFVEE